MERTGGVAKGGVARTGAVFAGGFLFRGTKAGSLGGAGAGETVPAVLTGRLIVPRDMVGYEHKKDDGKNPAVLAWSMRQKCRHSALQVGLPYVSCTEWFSVQIPFLKIANHTYL